MNYRIDYLLKYISNDTYRDIVNNKSLYILEDLEDNRVDVDLNIRYLIKCGIKHIDRVVYNRLDDLLLNHNDFIDKMDKYEQSLGKDGFIDMLENV